MRIVPTEQEGKLIRFHGGPFDGCQMFLALESETFVIPGACPQGKDGTIYNHHLEDCACPLEFKGPQEYLVRDGRADYVGQRDWPQNEDEDEDLDPSLKLWTP